MFSARLCQALAFATAMSAALQANSAPLYEVVDIGAAGYSFSQARGLNSAGDVVGTVWNISEDLGHAFVYSSGSIQVLGTLGGTGSQGRGINDMGLVVGNSRNVGGQQRGFLWDGATMTDLGTLGGSGSSAAGINEAGQVTGAAALPGGDSRAYRWQAGAMTDLGTLGGEVSSGWGINDAGDVIGQSTVISDPYIHLFLYSGGAMIPLGTRETPAFNNLGQVTGGSYSGFGPSIAFLLDGGTTTLLGTLGGDSSRGRGINDSGQIVGDAQDATNATNAFLYQDGVMLDLNDHLAPYAGTAWHLRTAYAINESGWIVGAGERDGAERAFLLRPVPEPSTVALVLFGLAAFAVRHRMSRHAATG